MFFVCSRSDSDVFLPWSARVRRGLNCFRAKPAATPAVWKIINVQVPTIALGLIAAQVAECVRKQRDVHVLCFLEIKPELAVAALVLTSLPS
jgi:hypothetical protein